MSQPTFKPYHAPAGGWGSAYSVANILIRQKIPLSGASLLLKQNKPIDGFACVSCAWAKPHPSRPLSFCENGAKATSWAGDQIEAVTEVDDGVHRAVGPLRVTPYDIPEGCCAGYYPECNVLLQLWHHAKRSKVPAAKSIPIRLRKVIAAA